MGWKWKRRKTTPAEDLAWGIAALFAGMWARRVTPLAMEAGCGGWRYVVLMGGMGFLGVLVVFGVLSTAIGAGRMAAGEFGGGRKGWRGLLRFALGAVAGWCGAWGVAVAAPVAWRKGDRRGAMAGIAGTVLFYGVNWVFAFWPSTMAVVSWGWGLLATQSAGAALLLRSVWRLEGRPRLKRGLAWAMVAVGLLGLALWPGWRVEKLTERADAAMAALRDGSPGPLDRAVPPVAEADDPVAALNAATLAAETADWKKAQDAFYCGSDGFPNRQLTAEEWAEAELWLAGHPVFMAAAEAISTPGYRSCLPGASAPEDFTWDNETGSCWLEEPRLSWDYARALALRAGVEGLRGDKAAALADIDRGYAFAEHCLNEPALIAKMIGNACGLAAVAVAGQRFDLWDDAELDGLVVRAEAFRERVEGAWAGAFADEAYCSGETMRRLGVKLLGTNRCAKALAGLEGGCLPSGSPLSGTLRHWEEYERLAFAREMERLHRALEAALAMPPGPERAAALSAVETETEAREEDLTLVGIMLMPSEKALAGLRTRRENDCATLRLAVAAERWRRAHDGALPESAEALVPEFLDAVPLDAELGGPLRLEPLEDGRGFAVRRPDGAPKREQPQRFWVAPPPVGGKAEADDEPTARPLDFPLPPDAASR